MANSKHRVFWRNDAWESLAHFDRVLERARLGGFGGALLIVFGDRPWEIELVSRLAQEFRPENITLRLWDFNVPAYLPLLEVALGMGVTKVQVGNEPNAQSANIGESARWWEEWLVVLTSLPIGIQVVGPGLTPNVDEEDWLPGLLNLCPLIPVHVYWEEGYWDDPDWGLKYEKYHQLFPDKRLLVTEWGMSSSSSEEARERETTAWLERALAQPYIEAVHSFIVDSPDPQWAKFVPSDDLLRAWAKVVGKKEAVMTWDRHKVFDDWFKAGGAEGYNPNTAIGGYRSIHPHLGMPAGGERDYGEAVVQFYSGGIVYYDKVSGQVGGADDEEGLPLTLPLV